MAFEPRSEPAPASAKVLPVAVRPAPRRLVPRRAKQLACAVVSLLLVMVSAISLDGLRQLNVQLVASWVEVRPSESGPTAIDVSYGFEVAGVPWAHSIRLTTGRCAVVAQDEPSLETVTFEVTEPVSIPGEDGGHVTANTTVTINDTAALHATVRAWATDENASTDIVCKFAGRVTSGALGARVGLPHSMLKEFLTPRT